MFIKILSDIIVALLIVNIYIAVTYREPPQTVPRTISKVSYVPPVTTTNVIPREPVKLVSRGNLDREKEDTKKSMPSSKNIISNDRQIRKINMTATAYDLSVQSCGKRKKDDDYGITASGTTAKFKRTVAVDKRVIPLGTKVYITFPDKYKHLNGTYIAEDTGRLIKGNKIDIFLGEDALDECLEFGKQKVEIRFYVS